MKRKAQSLVTGYVERFSDDLRRVWATERSFELHVDGAIVAGRADVILDREGGREGSLAVVDYKTAGGDDRGDRFRLQLRVYSEAGIREGVDVTAAYVHQLEDGSRERIAVEPAQRAEAVQAVQDLADALRARSFTPKPCAETCGRCDFRPLCRHRDQAPAHQR
jgi:DNA helicase-2/ATP-dependent DNA helicase PcrA